MERCPAYKAEKNFDIILLDEFQKIKISEDSSILQILREGKKFDFGVILSSQFIAHYDSDILSALLQCATSLFFHPIGKDATAIVKPLSVDNSKKWELLLKKLEVGEAVLCGNYRLNNNKKVLDTPIWVKVLN